MPLCKDDSDMILNIKESSYLGFKNNISIVDNLLSARWCEEEDLIRAFNIIDNSDLNMVVVFFQVPFVIRLPKEMLELKHLYGSVMTEFRPIGSIHNTLKTDSEFSIDKRTNYSSVEKFINAYIPDDRYGLMTKTQVLMVFELWGVRNPFYEKYINALENEKAYVNNILVSKTKSWLPDLRPLTAATYEIDLAQRLRREAIIIINEFIPKYSIVCHDPYAIKQEQLDSFFVMVKTGRIITLGPNSTILSQSARPFNFDDYTENLNRLKLYIDSSRSQNIYELYLLNALKKIDEGSQNLAVVETIMILDWFANEIIEDHLMRRIKILLGEAQNISEFCLSRMWEIVNNHGETRIHVQFMDKFTKYFPVIGINIPADMIGKLRKIYKVRSTVVHQIHTNKQIAIEEARNAISTGMAIIQFSIDSVKQAVGNKTNAHGLTTG